MDFELARALLQLTNIVSLTIAFGECFAPGGPWEVCGR